MTIEVQMAEVYRAARREWNTPKVRRACKLLWMDEREYCDRYFDRHSPRVYGASGKGETARLHNAAWMLSAGPPAETDEDAAICQAVQGFGEVLNDRRPRRVAPP